MNVIDFGLKILAMAYILGMKAEEFEMHPTDEDSLPAGLCPDPFQVFWAEFHVVSQRQKQRILRCAGLASLVTQDEGRTVIIRPIRSRCKV